MEGKLWKTYEIKFFTLKGLFFLFVQSKARMIICCSKLPQQSKKPSFVSGQFLKKRMWNPWDHSCWHLWLINKGKKKSKEFHLSEELWKYRLGKNGALNWDYFEDSFMCNIYQLLLLFVEDTGLLVWVLESRSGLKAWSPNCVNLLLCCVLGQSTIFVTL